MNQMTSDMGSLCGDIKKWESIRDGELDLFRGTWSFVGIHSKKTEQAHKKYQETFDCLLPTRCDWDETILTISAKKRKKMQPRIERILVVLNELASELEMESAQ